jgi:hypothetical protein
MWFAINQLKLKVMKAIVKDKKDPLFKSIVEILDTKTIDGHKHVKILVSSNPNWDNGSTELLREKHLSVIDGNIEMLYETAQWLFDQHVNNEGNLDYSEKTYGWLCDDLDLVLIGWYGNEPDGTRQQEYYDSKCNLTKEEVVLTLDSRINQVINDL